MQPSIRQMNLDGLSRVGVVALPDIVAQKCLSRLVIHRDARYHCLVSEAVQEKKEKGVWSAHLQAQEGTFAVMRIKN